MARSTHFTVHEVSAYLVTVTPEASSRSDNRLIAASPVTAKSAPGTASAPPSDQVRKPNERMRSLSRFSATGDCRGGASARSASRVAIRTEILGSPPARIRSMRSARESWLTDFCTARTSTTACVVIVISPSLPSCGALSSTTAPTKLPLFASSLSFSVT